MHIRLPAAVMHTNSTECQTCKNTTVSKHHCSACFYQGQCFYGWMIVREDNEERPEPCVLAATADVM